MLDDFKVFLKYNKKERKGIVILSLLIVVTLFINWAIDTRRSAAQFNLKHVLTSTPVANYNSVHAEHILPKNAEEEILPFDPNSFIVADWVNVGFSEKQAAAIVSYINRFGKLRSKQDFKKIHVVSEKKYVALEKYLLLPDSVSAIPKPYTSVKNTVEVLDLNSADSLKLLALPLVGPVITHRLLLYKNKLGGYYSVSQIKEVYGISDSAFAVIEKRLMVNDRLINKININNCSAADLSAHPYISKKQAMILFNYRVQHGAYAGEPDVKSSKAFDDAELEKIIHYLKFD